MKGMYYESILLIVYQGECDTCMCFTYLFAGMK